MFCELFLKFKFTWTNARIEILETVKTFHYALKEVSRILIKLACYLSIIYKVTNWAENVRILLLQFFFYSSYPLGL